MGIFYEKINKRMHTEPFTNTKIIKKDLVKEYTEQKLYQELKQKYEGDIMEEKKERVSGTIVFKDCLEFTGDIFHNSVFWDQDPKKALSKRDDTHKIEIRVDEKSSIKFLPLQELEESEIYHSFNAEEAEKYIGKECLFCDYNGQEERKDVLQNILEKVDQPFQVAGGLTWGYLKPFKPKKITPQEAEKMLTDKGVYVKIDLANSDKD